MRLRKVHTWLMSNGALQYAHPARLSEPKICRSVDLRVRENLDRKKTNAIKTVCLSPTVSITIQSGQNVK